MDLNTRGSSSSSETETETDDPMMEYDEGVAVGAAPAYLPSSPGSASSGIDRPARALGGLLSLRNFHPAAALGTGRGPPEAQADRSDSAGSSPSRHVAIPPHRAVEFMKSLECPICMEILIPPVINCANGHIVCSICRPKMKKCGLCHASYTTSRNFALEGILSIVEATCRHVLCDERVKVDKLVEHMGICDYRPIKCFETNGVSCRGKEIEYTAYLRHLTQDHKLQPKVHSGLEFRRINISNTLPVKWPIFQFKMAGQTFLLHREPSQSQQSLCVWITLLEKDEDATKYRFRIRIVPPASKNNTISYVEWNIGANSVHKSMKDAIESLDCMVLSTELIEPYCERRAPVQLSSSSRNSGVEAVPEVYEYKWAMNISLDLES